MRRGLRAVVLVSSLVSLLFLVSLTATGPLSTYSAPKPDQSGLDRTGALDLSAILLTPLDLADVGLDGYAYLRGGTDTLDDEFLRSFSSPDRTSAETEEMFEDTGFVRSRRVSMDLPSEEDPGLGARRVTVWVDEFTESGDSLSDVFEVYLDFGGARLDGSRTVGDQSGIAAYNSSTSDTGVATVGMSLAFRHGNLIGQVEIIDFVTYSPDLDPEIEEVEALAERLLERIEMIREEGGPGLSNQALRFESDGRAVFYTTDFYTRLGVGLLPRYGQNEEQLERHEALYSEVGITDVFHISQAIGWNSDADVDMTVTLRQFEDGDDVAEWVAAGDEWSEAMGFMNVEIIDDDLDIGDRAMAVAYWKRDAGERVDPHSVAIFIQIGDIGVTVQLSFPGEPPDLDIVAVVAEMQVECLGSGACPTESELPAALIELAESLD